jgi:drug/metabolite transporter (DMT)-like permease
MTALPRPTDAPLRGILLMCAAMAFLALMATAIKHLTQTYPTAEILWARFFFHFLFVLMLFPRRIPTLLVSRRKGLQIARSVVMLFGALIAVSALRYIQVAEFVALTFIAPALVAGLSVVILREHVGARRWASVAVGFVGVLIIVRPGTGVMHWAAALPLGVAMCQASYQIMTRLLSQEADVINSLVYTALVGTVVTTLAVPFFWVPPQGIDWLLMACVGFLGGAGHFAMIKAYERAAAAVVAPLTYSELIWATLAGFAVFGDLPDAWTFVGAAIIAASGIYILHRERLRRSVA